MSHGRIHGSRPPIAPVTRKPGESAQGPGRADVKQARGGTLGPGQHLVLPARTGLAHYRDHFDTRDRPDYDARLKGEAPPPPNPQAVPPQADSLLPPRLRLDDEEDSSRDDEHGESAEAEPEPEPELIARTVELQGGLFTLAEGSLDARQHPLATLEAFLDGDVFAVSVAVDLSVIPYGTTLSIRSLDARFGRPIVLRAVHQTERTAGAALGYLEICVSSSNQEMIEALDRVLAVTIG